LCQYRIYILDVNGVSEIPAGHRTGFRNDGFRATGGESIVGEWDRHDPPGVRRHLEYPRIPLFGLLERTAAAYPNAPALWFRGLTMTYGELLRAVYRCANALRGLGVREGDRVALMIPNAPQYVIAYYGILKAGGIVAQVNPLYVEREIEHQLVDCGARVMVVADHLYPKVAAVAPNTGLQTVLVARMTGAAEMGPGAISFEETLQKASDADPAVPVRPDAVAVLQYTGGTTGVAKGAMLTHANLVANALQTHEWFRTRQRPPGEHRVLTLLPLFHCYGMTCCMNHGIVTGAQLILVPRLDIDELMATIRETRPTSFPGVPTMYAAVLSYPRADEYGVSAIELCNSGGAPMPLEIMRQFEERFGATITEGYGLSEASPVTHINPVNGLRKPGSIGLPVSDTDYKIVDVETGTRELPPGEDGELIVRGPQVMAGYWGMEEETRGALREFDGQVWLYTGDICRRDEDGYVYVTDRKKDMIVAGGYNIYPREVEEVLYLHPAVREAAVVGVADPYRGETVKAFLALKPGHSVTPEELDRHCRRHLAPFKVPRLFEFREQLPKSAVGKVLRRVLAEEERRKQSAG